jgi:16S rRNA (uracil1498-N3)-methyltransferase
MVRLYIDTQLDTGKTVSLQDYQIHYLRNVLRLKENDAIQVFNAHSGEWGGRLVILTKSQGAVLLQQRIRAPEPESDVDLLFAPLKQEAMHYLIEKVTELGVSRLFPVMTEFTQISRVNQEKVARYCMDAAQQCERLSVPEVFLLRLLEEVLLSWEEGRLLIVCLERQESVALAPLLQQLPLGQKVTFLIGPEGGLGAKDIMTLSKYSFVRFCRMGARILRAETAAVAALACYQALRGDWQ